jgi:hypothetical protein
MPGSGEGNRRYGIPAMASMHMIVELFGVWEPEAHFFHGCASYSLQLIVVPLPC